MGKDRMNWAQYQYKKDKPKCSKYSNRILYLERLPTDPCIQNIHDSIKGVIMNSLLQTICRINFVTYSLYSFHNCM